MGQVEINGPLFSPGGAPGRPDGPLTLRILDDLAEASPVWTGFERQALPALSQAHDWLIPWYTHVGQTLGHQPIIVIGMKAENIVFLWPLARVGGPLGMTLEWLGAANGNQMPGLWCPAALPGLPAQAVASALKDVARISGTDQVRLVNVPAMLNGAPHPLGSLPHRPSVSAVHVGGLDQPYEALLRRRHDRDSRRKLDKKAKGLARLGPVSLLEPVSPDNIRSLLDIFTAQREARARTSGIPNVFADAGLNATLFAALNGTGTRPPVLRIVGLQVAGKIRATYITGRSGNRLCCYANSIAQDDSLPFSPGVQLLTMLIRRAAEDPDLTLLDLGLGDERYKHAWTEPEPLFDIGFARSARGHLALLSATFLAALKRRVRASRHLWSLYRRLRKWVIRGEA